MNCRHCTSELGLKLIDLGSAPPSNAYLSAVKLQHSEKWYPLNVMVCERCWLVQTQDFARADELFDAEYAYFSGFSNSWLAHVERCVGEMVARFQLSSQSQVVEVASNDGYLLQYVQARKIPCFGIEPTASTAAAARAKGIETIQAFFGVRLAQRLASEGKQADLAVANNVLAHVPDINDFVAGFAVLLKPAGVVTFEFPHLLRLIEENQFDTIYHEHFSYLSLTAIQGIFSGNGLTIFHVEEHATHGGSLRVIAQRCDTGTRPADSSVETLLSREESVGMRNRTYYTGFQSRAENIKNEFVGFLIEAKRTGKTIAAYGAAAKGNTLMNFAGVRPDLISYVVDRNPAKQGKFMPGSRIPIVSEPHMYQSKPDYVVILPWNIKSEVMEQLSGIRSWGAQFVTAVPNLEVR